MNSGLMDSLIQVQTPTYTNSAYGVAVKPSGYSTVKNIWARIQYNGGSEAMAADKREYRETASVSVHYIDGNTIGVTDVLYFDSKRWNIKGIQHIGRRQYIKMEVENVS
jgi:head-tail adaptor